MGRILLLFLIIVGSPDLSLAGRPVVLTDEQEQYPLGRMLEYLEDPSRRLTINDVTSPEFSTRFIQSPTDVPGFGYTTSAYWVRIRLRNKASHTTNWRLVLGFPNMQDAACFRPRADGSGFDVIRTGTRRPFASREIPYHRFVFDISPSKTADDTVYLRFQNTWAMTFPLTLWSLDGFMGYIQRDILEIGLVYGAFFLLILYNLFLWIALKERNYGYYVGVLTCMLLGLIIYEGLGLQYGWPDAPQWNDLLSLLFFPVASILGMMFAISFLDTRKRAPIGHVVIIGCIAAWSFVLLFIPFADHIRLHRFLMPLRLANSLVFTGINYWVWKRGYRPARYFFFAWLMTAMTFIPFAMTRLGLAPCFSLADQGFRFGMILTGLLFSFALADRIQNLQQEIFERRKIEARLQIDKETAEAASLAKSRFLSMMSHEFRTPLNAILGYAELLRRETPTGSLAFNGLKTIEHSGRHLLQLIEDLLDLAKIEAGKIEVAHEDFFLTEELDRVAAMMRQRASQKGLMFVSNPPTGLPSMVKGDARRLRQVLLNLLGNAVKFTNAGKVRLDVASLGDDHLRFSIEDTGPGIPLDKLEAIFSPFARIKETGHNTEGAGLGLSISRSMVRLLGGELHVKSVVGEGSAFWFTLRLPEVLDARAFRPVTRRPVVGFQGNPRHILIVDDNRENRSMLRHALEALGFNIMEAENGGDALFWLEKEAFDAVLMDLMMPVMDGFEATRRMRQSLNLCHLKIIIMTADAAMRPADIMARTGCDGVLTKPLDHDRLLEQLHSHLHLEWIYGDAKVEERPAPALTVPSSANVEKLRHFAKIGAYTELMEELTILGRQGPEAEPFAAHLLGMLDRFQFEAILAYLYR